MRKSLRKNDLIDGFAEAYETALRALGGRDRFEVEMRLRLASFSEETVAAVLARLKVQHILDDRKLVLRLIEGNTGPKAISIAALRAKCAERGASEDALKRFDVAPEINPEPVLTRFEPIPKNRGRAGRYLASKGFDEDAIEAALDRHFGPNGKPDETYNADEA